MSDTPNPHEHLYETPIEELELSDTAINALKKTGITNVGDCIDFYLRLPDVLISARPVFFRVIRGEVKEKMKEHGYWTFVENDSQ